MCAVRPGSFAAPVREERKKGKRQLLLGGGSELVPGVVSTWAMDRRGQDTRDALFPRCHKLSPAMLAKYKV